MLGRILKESFKRQKRRKAIAVAAIALGTAVATSLVSVSLNIEDKVRRELKAYGANIILVPRGDALPLEIGGLDFSPFLKGEYLEEADLIKIKEIFWKHNIVGFAPFLSVTAESEGRPVVLTGTWFSKKMKLTDGREFVTGVKEISSYWKIDGDWIADERDTLGALVRNSLARKFNLRPGDSLEVNYSGKRYSLEVRGIITTGGAEENQIFTNLGLVQNLTGLTGKFKKLQVSALTVPENELYKEYLKDPTKMSSEDFEIWYCTPYVSAIVFQLEEVIANSKGKPVRQVAESEGVILMRIKLLLLLITGSALAASTLGVMSTMTTAVMERRLEIALARAIGAGEGQVAALFALEITIVGAIGGIAGFGLGSLLAQAIGLSVFGSRVPLPVVTLPLILIISVGVAILGSLLPVRNALRAEPAGILHGR